MSIIAISGHIDSGKDTVAKMIQYLMCVKQFGPDDGFRLDSSRDYAIGGWENKKFASKLKQIVSMFTGIPVQDLELESVKNSVLGPEWGRYSYGLGYYANDLDAKCHKMTYTGQRKVISKETYDRIVADGHKEHHRALHEQPTVRQLLQEIGTEALRDVIHPDIHVNGLFVDYKNKAFSTSDGHGYRGHMCNICNCLIEDSTMFICKGCLAKGNFPNWIISDLRFPNEVQAVVDRQGITLRVERHDLMRLGYINKDTPHPSETALDDYKFDYVIHNNGTLDDLLEEVRKLLIHFNLI